MRRNILSAIASIGILATQAQTPIVNYKFEQTLTSSGSGPTLTHSSNNPDYADITRSGNGDFSLSLRGSDFLSTNFSTPSDLTGYTINYWVKMRTKPNFNVGVCQLKYTQVTGLPNNYTGSFVTATNPSKKPYFEVYTSQTAASLYTAPDTLDNNWHMLTFRWKKDSAFIFVDGMIKLSAAGPSSFIASNEKLVIGALLNNINGINSYQSSFDGHIDEVRIFETNLSNASILNLYNTGSTTLIINQASNDINLFIYQDFKNATLHIKSSEHMVKAEILNINGSMVHREAGAIESISIANLAQGVYVLRLTANNGKQTTKKFTKE